MEIFQCVNCMTHDLKTIGEYMNPDFEVKYTLKQCPYCGWLYKEDEWNQNGVVSLSLTNIATKIM